MSNTYATGTIKVFNESVAQPAHFGGMDIVFLMLNIMIGAFIIIASHMSWYAFSAIPICITLHFAFKSLNKKDIFALQVLKANSRFFIGKHCSYLTAQRSVKGMNYNFRPVSIRDERVVKLKRRK